MFQKDIREELSCSSRANDGLVLLHFTRESCLESTTGLTRCLSHRKAMRALIQGFGGTTNVFNPVTWRNHVAQMSRHFQRYRELRWGYDEAMLDRDGKTISRWRVSDEGGTRQSELYIEPSFFANELRRRNLTALWCYDSIRWSERILAELGLAANRCGKEYSFPTYGYWFACGHEEEAIYRPRMKSWTRLCGQRLFERA